MINNNQNIPNNTLKKLTYDTEKIQELLNILNTMPFMGIPEAMKLVRMFDILNEPFNINKQFPNPNPKEIKEDKKD